MSLPTVTVPEHTLKLLSLDQPIIFRSYLVKEEKIFLMAKESGRPEDIEQAVQQILRNCTFGLVDITKLPSFDVEYLFLQLRAKSVNNIVEVAYECQNLVPSTNAEPPNSHKKCETRVAVHVDLDEVKLTVPPDHSTLVKLSNDLSLKMQYPTAAMLERVFEAGLNGIANATDVIARCIEMIIEEDGTVHESREVPIAEMQTFVEALPLEFLSSIYKFFTTMPSLQYDTTFTCPSCGYTEPLHFQGLLDFFD